MSSIPTQFDLLLHGSDHNGWEVVPKGLPTKDAELPALLWVDESSPVSHAYLKHLLPGMVMPAGVFLDSAHLAAIAALEKQVLFGTDEAPEKVLLLDSLAHLHDKGAFLADLKESLAATAEAMAVSTDPEEKYVAPAKQVQTQQKRCFIRSDRPFDPAMDEVHHYEQVGAVVYEVLYKVNGTRRRTSPNTAMLLADMVKYGDMLEYVP